MDITAGHARRGNSSRPSTTMSNALFSPGIAARTEGLEGSADDYLAKPVATAKQIAGGERHRPPHELQIFLWPADESSARWLLRATILAARSRLRAAKHQGCGRAAGTGPCVCPMFAFAPDIAITCTATVG